MKQHDNSDGNPTIATGESGLADAEWDEGTGAHTQPATAYVYVASHGG
jgi:hypothetical protein